MFRNSERGKENDRNKGYLKNQQLEERQIIIIWPWSRQRQQKL